MMKRLLLAIVLFCSYTLSAAPEKPSACSPYHCSDYEWDHHMKRFDPLSIHWPLHYTGETFKDYADGGRHQIDIVFQEHYHDVARLNLTHYRSRPECPNSSYLSEGIDMDDYFMCESNAITEPTWKSTGCSLVGVSMHEQTLNINEGGCAKKIRNWTVIDWCKFEPNGNVNAERNQDDYALVKDLVSNKVYFAFDDSYHSVQEDGWYTFTQVVKILDDKAPKFESCEDVSIELKDCSEEVVLTNKISDEGQCASKKLDVSLEVYNKYGELLNKEWFTVNNNQQISQSVGVLAPGSYLIFWSVNDGCGNYTHCNHMLTVTDGLAPQLICIHNVSTSMDADHGMSIWAKDFVLKADDLCADTEPVISFSADSLEMSRTFDCSDGPGFHNLTIYATDINGNTSSCEVELFITDTQACSDANRAVGGVITLINNDPIESVEVEIKKQAETVSMEMSNDRGQFFIRDIPMLKSKYILSPQLIDGISQGLEPTDLILLSRHIFGSDPFDDVLEFAAADINNDAKIDLDDYWALAHLIYDIPFTIDNFSSWKFIDQKLYNSGVNRASKLSVPVELTQGRDRYDLLAVKAGDIDFSWSPNEQASTRSAPFTITRMDAEEVELNWESDQDINSLILFINGMSLDQFSRLNPFVEATAVKTIEDGIYVHLSDITVLNSVKSVSINPEASINTTLSSIHFNNTEIESKPIRIEQVTNAIKSSYDLVATPNPFVDRITVKAPHLESFSSDIFVYNATGQVIKQVKAAGLNSVQIIWEDTDAKGVLFIQTSINHQNRIQKVLRLQ